MKSPVPEVTWSPTPDQVTGSRLWHFLRWVEEHGGPELRDYRSAWAWSVSELSAFWSAVWEYFEVIGDGYDGRSLGSDAMPGAEWFPGTSLNWAENLLRHARDPKLSDEPAIISIEEDDTVASVSWRELERQVAAFAASLTRLGVQQGDRVAAVLPNIPPTIVAVLATASIGAIWTVTSPDLSVPATLDRLVQLNPTVLIGVDGYRFNGKDFPRLDEFAQVRAGLPGLAHTILVRTLSPDLAVPDGLLSFAELVAGDEPPRYSRVPFDHPLWVLFTSGTTGAPKGIVHSHGGITIESYKGTALQQNMHPGDRFYVGANTSWMVWNLLVDTMISGSTIVTYSGSPTFRRADRQFEVAARTGVTVLAVGAAYLALVEKSGAIPKDTLDLSRLRSMQSAGSPLGPGTWRWVHEAVKQELHLGSDSGGTEIASGFVGSNGLEPVQLGELQGAFLGAAVESWSADGSRLINEVGEMVITRPMPSMPVAFWGDEDGDRYRRTYFEMYPGVWAHGDWITETDRGSFVIHGRSDATLNRAGVRLGSADIYAAVDTVPEIVGSLVVGAEQPDGGYFMPLFVVLAPGIVLDDARKAQINARIRARASARHVPDDIVEAPAIPISHAGKRMEIPVKRLLAGFDVAQAVNRSTLANPDSIDWFIAFAAARLSS